MRTRFCSQCSKSCIKHGLRGSYWDRKPGFGMDLAGVSRSPLGSQNWCYPCWVSERTTCGLDWSGLPFRVILGDQLLRMDFQWAYGWTFCYEFGFLYYNRTGNDLVDHTAITKTVGRDAVGNGFAEHNASGE